VYVVRGSAEGRPAGVPVEVGAAGVDGRALRQRRGAGEQAGQAEEAEETKAGVHDRNLRH
jgi:hypothetical protein